MEFDNAYMVAICWCLDGSMQIIVAKSADMSCQLGPDGMEWQVGPGEQLYFGYVGGHGEGIGMPGSHSPHDPDRSQVFLVKLDLAGVEGSLRTYLATQVLGYELSEVEATQLVAMLLAEIMGSISAAEARLVSRQRVN